MKRRLPSERVKAVAIQDVAGDVNRHVVLQRDAERHDIFDALIFAAAAVVDRRTAVFVAVVAAVVAAFTVIRRYFRACFISPPLRFSTSSSRPRNHPSRLSSISHTVAPPSLMEPRLGHLPYTRTR